MKFTCMKKELNDALRIVGKAVSSKSQMPILSGIYLKAKNSGLELQATDNETGFICHIQASIEEEGEIVLSGKYFQEVAGKLPGETINFEHDKANSIAHISSNMANFTLLSMNEADFPVITPLEGDVSFIIKNNVLGNLIRKTAFSCAADDKPPIFTGCCIELKNDTITMAATNTHRLAVKSETLTNPIGAAKIIVPARVLNDLSSIMTSDVPIDVKITCSQNKISFTFGNIYIFSRLIEGNYPDYNNVIPPSFTTKVRLNADDFKEAIDRVSLISRTNEYNIIRLEFGDNKVRISSNNPEIGNAEETMSAIIDGPEINIAFNAKYMIDVLKIIDEKEIHFSLNTNVSPISIRENNDDSFLYIATPVRTTH